MSTLPQSHDVLGDLLHSLNQPLTSLQCSLEISLVHSFDHSLERSIEEVTEEQQKSVSCALQQTEKVIGMVQLMREYLDAEHPQRLVPPVALAPALRSVVEELSSIAAVREIGLQLSGTSRTMLRIPPEMLRRALQYLIMATIEAQLAGSKILLSLREDAVATVLVAECEAEECGAEECRPDDCHELKTGNNLLSGRDQGRLTSSTVSTLARVRMAIASRILKSGGASLELNDAARAGFVLRIPSQVVPD
jgi:hypothetical protein